MENNKDLFVGHPILALSAAVLIAPVIMAQVPQFRYSADHKLTVHRTYETRAQCWDWRSSYPVESWTIHEDKRVMVPKALVKVADMNAQGGNLWHDWTEQPSIAALHNSQYYCDAGHMSADAWRSGASRIKADCNTIVMTTVESAQDSVNVNAYGQCGGGGGIFSYVPGKSRTWSVHTTESTVPFSVREPAILRMNRLYSYVGAYKQGPAAILSATAYARVEVYRDHHEGQVGALDTCDQSVWFQQGQLLNVQLGEPVMWKSSTAGPATVNLNDGRYLAVFTFYHHFEVETWGNFAANAPSSVAAGDDARGSVELSLLPALPSGSQ